MTGLISFGSLFLPVLGRFLFGFAIALSVMRYLGKDSYNLISIHKNAKTRELKQLCRELIDCLQIFATYVQSHNWVIYINKMC